MPKPAVHAVVVTHDRTWMLLECLAALAEQTHPLREVLVVDTASSEPTLDALERSGLGDQIPIRYLRLDRNGGGSEGFHYGVRAALEGNPDWLWLMDDDCEPAPGALAALLAAPRAAAPGTAALAPLVTTPGGQPLPLNRGWLRRRWFISPLVGLTDADRAAEEVEVDHVSLVGPLVPAAVARRTEPPRRELFIWWDDLEWVARLRRSGSVYVIPASRVVHKDERPLTGGGLRVRLRDFVRGPGFAAGWKRAYGLRNIVYCGRREGFFTLPRALAFTAVAALRALVQGPPRLRALRLTLAYARDGWRGLFLNVPPERWADLSGHPRPRRFVEEHALLYGSDVSSAIRRVGPRERVGAGE